MLDVSMQQVCQVCCVGSKVSCARDAAWVQISL